MLEVESGLHWYAIQIKPRKEKVAVRGLGALDLEVFLPLLRCRRRVGSRFHWILVPLFPGYMFCLLDLALSGKAARYTLGVKDFVKFGNRIAEVSVEVIRALRERCPHGIAQAQPQIYRAGEPVIIREGPFSGLEAVFEQKMKGGERVAVLLNILGRQTRLVLPDEMVGRI